MNRALRRAAFAMMAAAIIPLGACVDRFQVDVRLGETHCPPIPTEEEAEWLAQHVPRETPGAHYLATLDRFQEDQDCGP